MDLVYRYENKNDLLPQLFLNSPRMINGFRVFGIQSFCSSRNIVNGIKFLLGPCRWLLIRSSETEDINLRKKQKCCCRVAGKYWEYNKTYEVLKK